MAKRCCRYQSRFLPNKSAPDQDTINVAIGDLRVAVAVGDRKRKVSSIRHKKLFLEALAVEFEQAICLGATFVIFGALLLLCVCDVRNENEGEKKSKSTALWSSAFSYSFYSVKRRSPSRSRHEDDPRNTIPLGCSSTEMSAATKQMLHLAPACKPSRRGYRRRRCPS